MERNKLAFIAVIAVGIALPGTMAYVANMMLDQPGLGQLIWGVGFGSMVIVVWYVWLRPLDITGPEYEGGTTGPEWERDE